MSMKPELRSVRDRALWAVAAIVVMAILLYTLPPAASYPASARNAAWIVGL